MVSINALDGQRADEWICVDGVGDIVDELELMYYNLNCMERKILNELAQFPESKVYEGIRSSINKLNTKVTNDKNISTSSKQAYMLTFKQFDWGLDKVTPKWPKEVDSHLDKLRMLLQQFDRALTEANKGSSLFCGSSGSVKALQPIYKQLLAYQQVFPIISIYQDKKIKEEIVSQVLDIIQKNNINSKSEKSLKTDYSPIKEQTIRTEIKTETKTIKRDNDYYQLMLASTILPNGYIVKKLIKELPDVEWLAGILYQEGKVVDKDLNKAINYYEEARKKKNPEAIYRLGLLNEANKYGKPNQYLKMWEQSAKMGHLAAMTDLGYLYENGLQDEQTGNMIIEVNNEKALSYYTEAANKNYPRALNNLASFYYNDPTYKNQKKCLEYFQRATQAEYVKSLHNLGLIYYEGDLVPFNEAKAISLIKRSAEKGDIQGKLAYIQMILNQPQKHNEEELCEINKYCREIIAEEEDNSQAYHLLGMMYEGGYGVPQQPKTALLYYSKAARFNNPNAYIKLGECYKNGFGVQQDLKQAIRSYEKAKDTNPQVFVYMGKIYENGGPDFPQNHKIAFDYYYNACNHNIAEGMHALGMMYQNGKHCKQSTEKAKYYFTKAQQLKKKPSRLNSSSELIQSSYFRSRK